MLHSVLMNLPSPRVLQVANTPIAMPGFADLSVIVTIVLLGMVWCVSFGKVEQGRESEISCISSWPANDTLFCWNSRD